MSQLVKKPSAIQENLETLVNPLEKEMATQSSIFAKKIPWTEEPGRLQSKGSQRVGLDLATKQTTTLTLHSIEIVRAKHRCC